MTRVQCFAAAVAVCVAGLTPAVASAASGRVWVSGHGVDQAGCGAPTAPCRSLQYAHDNAVVAGGEIDILDPAGYGAVTIAKAISIVNDGVGTAGVQASSGTAITINGGASDSIYLRGLNVDGQQQAGINGIVFNTGSSLTVVNCVIRHFGNYGLAVLPASGQVSVLVSSTFIADNASDGFRASGGDTSNMVGSLDHVTSARNGGAGAFIIENHTGTASFVIVDSILRENFIGFEADSGGISGVNVLVYVDNTHMDANPGDGFGASGPVEAHLSRSVVDDNHHYGVANATTSPGAIYSTGDNRLAGNRILPVLGPSMSTEPLY